MCENKAEITIKEVEVQKLNVQPGEVLVCTISSPDGDLDRPQLELLRKKFRELFPNNKTIVVYLGGNGVIKFNTIKESQLNEGGVK